MGAEGPFPRTRCTWLIVTKISSKEVGTRTQYKYDDKAVLFAGLP